MTQAIKEFDLVLTREAQNTKALFNKALALEKLRRWAEAAILYGRVLSVDPNDLGAYKNRELAREMIDDPGEN